MILYFQQERKIPTLVYAIIYELIFFIFYFCIVMFPKLDLVLNYFNVSPLNNRRVMDFFKSAVHKAIDMRDKGDEVS
jgi:hypothetical protein